MNWSMSTTWVVLALVILFIVFGCSFKTAKKSGELLIRADLLSSESASMEYIITTYQQAMPDGMSEAVDQAVRSIKVLKTRISIASTAEAICDADLKAIGSDYDRLSEAYMVIYNGMVSIWDKVSEEDKESLVTFHTKVLEFDDDARAFRDDSSTDIERITKIATYAALIARGIKIAAPYAMDMVEDLR